MPIVTNHFRRINGLSTNDQASVSKTSQLVGAPAACHKQSALKLASTSPSQGPRKARHLSRWRCSLTDREQVVNGSPALADAQAAPLVERQPHKLLRARHSLT